MLIQPYLFSAGRCEESIEFYRRALGFFSAVCLVRSDSTRMIYGGFKVMVDA